MYGGSMLILKPQTPAWRARNGGCTGCPSINASELRDVIKMVDLT